MITENNSGSYLNQSLFRNLFFVLLLINWHAIAYSQIIKGTILDKDTKSPVGFAYLYFSGTFVGTQTDQNGNFTMEISKDSSIPLTISAIGYYSVTLNDYLTGKPLLVYLIPKVYALNEVKINAKSLARRRKANLILFKTVFLGTTNNARYCEILNETDITFNYDSDKDTLKAFAYRPILIENKALGYSITYHLDKFEYTRTGRIFFFKGNMIFNEDLNTDATQKQLFEMRRREAYLGSRMHFFRALWLEDLRSEGFAVKAKSGRNLAYKDIVREDINNQKFLRYNENLHISYNPSEASSGLEFLKDKVYFSGDGYFDSEGIAWEGDMANLRIGDWLPYEYSIQE